MIGTLISLIAVVLAFSALLIWVYAPSRREEMRDTANLVFDDVSSADVNSPRTENAHE